MLTANAIAEVNADVKSEEMDEFGRTEAERTIVLSPRDAENINLEVAAGGHQTYDGCVSFVISRGFAEIKRTRDSQRKAQAKTKLANETALFTNMLAMNPALVSDPVFVSKMIAQLGELSKKTV